MLMRTLLLVNVARRSAALRSAAVRSGVTSSSNLARRRLGRFAVPAAASTEAALATLPASFDAWFKSMPARSVDELRRTGYDQAAPIQTATWGEAVAGRGAAMGESLAIHAPTGSGKTLAMVLPVVANAIWSGRPGSKVLILVPTRELAAQHEAVVRLLVGAEAVQSVTTSSVGNDALDDVAAELPDVRVVVATPNELAQVFEANPELYGEGFAARCEGLVVDEVDLLMPAKKYSASKFSRWQDRGESPAEAIVKLIAKRTRTLQVLAGSATLDSASKRKLEGCLKHSAALKNALPLRTVTLGASALLLEGEGGEDPDEKGNQRLLVTKIKFSENHKATERSTIVPHSIAHYTRQLPKAADAKATLKAVRDAVAQRPNLRAAIVFTCSSSGIKVRALTDALRKKGAFELGDVLWPDAARARRKPNRRFTPAAKEPLLDAADREALTRAQSAVLNDRIRAATVEHPCIVVADQAVARGLHLDDLDSVFIVGKPSNADSYLHMAGRTGRNPFIHETDTFAYEPTVVTLATHRDLLQLQAWLVNLANVTLRPLPVPPPPPVVVKTPPKQGGDAARPRRRRPPLKKPPVVATTAAASS